MLRRAFMLMRTGRSGPVLLEVPGDVAEAEVRDDLINTYRPVRKVASAGADEDVTAAVAALLAASKPLIHAGQGVLMAGASKELVEFAELVDAPVMTTTAGKGAMPEDHPLAVGSGGAAVSGGVMHFLPTADLLFSVAPPLAHARVLSDPAWQDDCPVHSRRA